jgi:maltooligosyltrehalose trehalohydrolase
MNDPTNSRRLPIGAELNLQQRVHFRVWAPRRQRVEVILEGGSALAVELTPEQNGYFSGLVPQATIGSRYRFRLDGGPEMYPDPASRFQPDGPHGPSPSALPWSR